MGENTLMIGTDCGFGGRGHPQIAWVKLRALRNSVVIANKKLWS
jgi:5-methyltetrahydropteroyltriglutamate--homocysteine methyltransferase